MHVSTLLNVPSKGFNYYAYVADPKDQFGKWLNENFHAIAEQIGSNNLIVRGGSSGSYDQELYEFLSQHCESNLFGILEGLFHESVSLIVSEGALHSTSGQVYVIPITREFDVKDSPQNQLATELFKLVISAISNNELEQRLEQLGAEQFELKEKKKNLILSTLKFVNKYLELKPNLAGVGINLNQVIEDTIKNYK
ncbi:hypothetical protein [Fulvivirga marina]|nr:hypothetical protein [Fulvivirga marina]